MSKVEIRRIEKLTDKETDQIVSLLVRAYVDNPAVPAMTGGNNALEDLLFRAMVRAGGLAGELYVLENEWGHILSMALWYGPGKTMFSTEEERNLGLNEFIGKLDEQTRDWWNTTYPQVTGQFIKTWLPISLEDCWYLNILGTDPNHQRKGYATFLLNDAIQNINSHNLLAFCSSSDKTADYYVKAGFPIRGRMDMPTKGNSFAIFGHSREI